MGLFHSDKAVAMIQDDLRALSGRVDSLESAHKRLSLEWEDLYDKVRHQMSRMSKRHAAAAKLNGEPEEVETEPGPYDHMDPVSKSIMLRRAGLGGRK